MQIILKSMLYSAGIVYCKTILNSFWYLVNLIKCVRVLDQLNLFFIGSGYTLIWLLSEQEKVGND